MNANSTELAYAVRPRNLERRSPTNLGVALF